MRTACQHHDVVDLGPAETMTQGSLPVGALDADLIQCHFAGSLGDDD